MIKNILIQLLQVHILNAETQRQKGKTNTMAKEETKECQGICRVPRAVRMSLRILQAVRLLSACSHIKKR